MIKEIPVVVSKAHQLEILNDKSMTAATEMLSDLNIKNDWIIEQREKVTKPLNAALKAERDRWRPSETALAEGIAILRKKISAYQTEKVRKEKEEEKKIAGKLASGKIKVETAVKKFEEMDRVVTKVVAESGLVRFNEEKKLKITNPKKLPSKYFIVTLDEKKLLADLKSGIEVEGAEIEIIQVPVNVR